MKSSSRIDKFIFGDDLSLKDLLSRQLSNSGECLIYISGPPKSGKTHLLLGQCYAAQDLGFKVAYFSIKDLKNLNSEILDGLENQDLIAIDDIDYSAGDEVWENSLFRFFNKAREKNCRLLFSAEKTANNILFKLADLRSRLSWGITYRIQELNDKYKKDLLRNLAERKGLNMSSSVASFLIDHHKRDYNSLLLLVEKLDHDSLAEKKKLSIPFVKARLKELF
tara:strand:- start:32923 stop:33591 length:669 start_codon:yes stop_codon:yes gene_type:complete